MRRAKILLLCYLGGIALFLVAATVGIALSPPVVRDRDTFYEVYWNTTQTFDPARAYDTVSSKMVEQCVEALYEYDYDDPGFRIIPALAAELPEVSEDGLTYTVRLRPNVRYPALWYGAGGKLESVMPWGDEPRYVTAPDFVFSMKRIADFHNATDHFGGIMQGKIVGADEYFSATEERDRREWYYDDLEIEGVRALDNFTLQFSLVKPFPQFIYKIAHAAVSPMPREYYYHYAVETPTRSARGEGTLGVDATLHNRRTMRWKILGTGPYRLVDYKREQHIKFERNPMYRGRPDVDGNPSGEGGVNPSLASHEILPRGVERQHWGFSREALPRWFNFTLGAFDKIEQIPKDKFESAIKGGEIAPDQAARGMKQARIPWPSIEYIAFHLEDPSLRDNIHLRRAMSLAIDRHYYIKQFRKGDGLHPAGLAPPGSFTWDPDFLAPMHRQDIDEAKREAELARQLHRDTFDEELPAFRVSFRNTSTATRQTAEYLQLCWEAVGIEVRPDFTDFGKWLDDLRARNFEIFSGGWVGDYPDEETFLQLFFSENYEEGSNSTGFSNPEYDAWYGRAAVLPDGPERRELYTKMCRMIEDELPVIVLYYRVRREIYYDWLDNVRPHVYCKAQPAYYELDGALREARLSGELSGTLEDLRARGDWPPADRSEDSDGSSSP